MKRGFSTGFMVAYWIALPILALATIGLGWSVLAPDGNQSVETTTPLWMSFLLSTAITLLIIWRLWTHERARKLAADRASTSSDASENNDD